MEEMMEKEMGKITAKQTTKVIWAKLWQNEGKSNDNIVGYKMDEETGKISAKGIGKKTVKQVTISMNGFP